MSALASCNRLETLHACLRDALHEGIDPTAIYEILLQTYLFAGFPAALEGLRALRDEVKQIDIAWNPPDAALFDVQQFRERGEQLYANVYAANAEPLRAAVKKFSPDMFEYMIIEGYGKVLSRGLVTGAQRELATVTALTALGWVRQTISHVRGAINLGASVENVHDAIAIAEECCSREQVQRTMDAIQKHLP